VFELTPDADIHNPGQTASILVRSPFQYAQAMVIVEAPDGNRYQAVRVRGGKATVRVPIEKEWVPRIPVHVVLERGRTAAPSPADPEGTDLGKPATVASTLWLKVAPVENTVEVTLDHPERALPGQTIPMTVRLRDPHGRPVKGEVTLWLVDKAVLALGEEQRLDPLPDFITDRRSYVLVRDSRGLTFGRVPYEEMPGGDGEAEEDVDEESPLDKATIRRDFRPVPFFDPRVMVGASGEVTVDVKLPDNLTVFKVRAKAASGPDRFGVGKSEVAVRLPLIVQPALPRFVRPGDTFEAVAIGRVVEGSGGPGAAQIDVEGLTLRDGEKRSVTWDDVRAERLAFPVAVPTPAMDDDGRPTLTDVTVRVGVSRSSDGAADAFEVVLPIQPDRRPLYVRELADLLPGEPWEVPAVPEPPRAGTVRRSIVVADHPGMVRMAAALDFLRHAPMGNTEQRLARARAYLALGQFRTQLGMLDAKGELDDAVHDTLEWLPTVVDRNGNVSNWPGYTGYVTLTAWSMLFLVEAKEAGYPIDGRLMADHERALRQALRSDYRYFIDGSSWWERTVALEALASAGAWEDAYYSELARNARYLDHEGIAAVVLAGARAGKSDSAVTERLADALSDGVVVRLYEGNEIYGGLRDRSILRSPLILPTEARTVAAMTRALARVRPGDPRLPFMVDALVQLGKEDGWGNTNTNSAALLALSERLDRTSTPPTTISITEDRHTDTLSLGPDEPVSSRTSTGAGVATVTLRPNGAERAVGLATTRYVPEADGSKEEPDAQGFVVTRTLLRQTGEGTPADRLALERGGTVLELSVGDVVEDHVQVVNPAMRHYIALVVPLAAGMEPLNPRLATAPPEARPTGQITRAPAYVAYLDDRVAFYYEELPKGTYDFYFRTRATTPGSFVQPSAGAEMMYDRTVRGNSAGARVEIAALEE
jgi:uncharacterized protein YfaS (alpha-2-macroglobulin family)